MSEFACRKGHLMRSGDRVCPECGEPCYTMDGMTGGQIVEMERVEAHENVEGEEDE